MQTYDALNFLGSIPWRINKQALAVVDEAWTRGGAIAGLIPRSPPVQPTTSLTGLRTRTMPYNLMTQVSPLSFSLLPFPFFLCSSASVSQDDYSRANAPRGGHHLIQAKPGLSGTTNMLRVAFDCWQDGLCAMHSGDPTLATECHC